MKKRRGCIRFTVFIALYVAYLFMGAGVFSAVEQPKEDEMNKTLTTVKNAFYNKISDRVSEVELDKFLHVMLTANDKGLSVIQNSSRDTNWGIGQSFFFAGSIVTTIGYGNVTPQSYVGRIFCIVYAAIGIPLTLIMMTTLVERLLGPCTALFLWLQRRLGPNFSSLSVRLLHLALVAIVTLTLVFFLPAVVFMAVEPKWTYLDALYFCVISMTTIGLDDYVPGEAPVQPYRQLYKICATVYLLLGLMMMMLLLATVYEIPELNVSRFFRSSAEDEEHKLLGETGGPAKYSPQVNEGFEGVNDTGGKTHVARQTSKQ